MTHSNTVWLTSSVQSMQSVGIRGRGVWLSSSWSPISPLFAGILEQLGRPLAKAHHAHKGGEDDGGKHYKGGQFAPEHGLTVDKGTGGGSSRITPQQANQIKQGMESMKQAVQGKNIPNACFRGSDGIDWVDFLWGSPGGPAPDFKGGWGIAKKIAKRTYEHGNDKSDPSAARTLLALPMVILLGRVTRLNTTRNEEIDRIRLALNIKDELYVAFLVKDEKSPNHWLLSGYEVRAARAKGGPR